MSPEQIGRIGTKRIADLVSAAVELDRDIKQRELTLDAAKARLIGEGLSEFNRAQEEDKAAFPQLAGTTWEFTDNDGVVAQVAFPADGFIRGGFWCDEAGNGLRLDSRSKKVIKLGPVRELAGCAFNMLFNTFYKPKKAFDEIAAAVIPQKAKELAAILKEPQSPRVSFKTKAGATCS